MIPGLKDIFNASLTGTKFTNLGDFLSGFFNIVLFIAGALMLSWMAWGIFQYIFAGGDKDKLGQAQKRITWAIVGFLLVVASFAVSQYVRQFFPAQPVPVTEVKQ